MDYEVKEFIAKAMLPISRMGYTKNDTAEYITSRFDDLQMRPKEDVEKFIKWVDQKCSERPTDYIKSVQLVLKLHEVNERALNILCSAINSYLKDVQRGKEFESSTSKYVGNVKDKIQFTIKDAKLLYNKYYGYGYNGTEYSVYRIVGTDGNVYIWGTSNDSFDVGDTIAATVKDHRNYRGEQQTVITRGKIVYKDKNEDLSVMETLGGDYED